MNKLDILPNECKCEKCKRMCDRPCWGTPEDIKKIIDAGYGDKLMVDYWDGIDFDILCPALKGYEGKRADFFPRSEEGCTFLTKTRLCRLHKKGLKPSEGKIASCTDESMYENDDGPDLHETVAMTWNNKKAQKMVKDWKKRFQK